jgi:branched-chain amino acid transport system substrate-binding protein
MLTNGLRKLLIAGASGLLLTSAAFAADPYEINVMLPLTGGGAFLGKSEAETLKVVDELVNRDGGINGRPVHFTLHDDQSNPQVAVQLANQILAQRPAILIGPTLVATCNAIAPLMQRGPVQYCLSPGIHPQTGSYVFSASVSTYDMERVLIRYFRLRGWTQIAIILSTDATGQDAERGLDEILARPENAGVKLVARTHYNPSDVSVSAQIETIKAAKPQALIAWSTGSAVATIFKAIIQADLNIPVGTTDGNMTFAQMSQYSGFLPKQLFIPAAVWPPHKGSSLKLDAQVEAVQDKFQTSLRAHQIFPDQPATQMWDTVFVVVDALRKLGPTADAQKLRDYLATLQGYAGINGIYDFKDSPQRGLGEHNTIVTLWDAAAQNWNIVTEPTGIPLRN